MEGLQRHRSFRVKDKMKVEIQKNSHSNINLVFLAGGPGLSSISFRPLSSLSEKYTLHFIDPMGTTSKLKIEPTYSNLFLEIEEYIEDIENVVLCGHSFGGIQAIDLASRNKNNIKGLISIGAPVSKNAFEILSANFKEGLTEEHNVASEKLSTTPTNEIYKEWFYIYRNFYFNPEFSDKSIEVITQDQVCVKSYTAAISESSQKEQALKALGKLNFPKLLIAGDLDQVLPPQSALHEAEIGGLTLKTIKNGGHFVHYECPDETINIIDDFLSNLGGKI